MLPNKLHGGRRARVLAVWAAVLSLLGAVAAGCGGGDASPAQSPDAPQRALVVTTTTVLADLVRNVGGDAVEVRSLVPPGADAHSYQTTPGDSRAISEARLIVANGAGLDDALLPVIDSAKAGDAVIVTAAEVKAGRVVLTRPSGDDGDASVDIGREGDPHLWLDPLLATGYVALIRDGLAEADPDSADLYRRNAAAYMRRLADLDQEIEAALRVVPPERRVLVTYHDAFRHFARRYGFQVAALAPHDAGEVTAGALRAVINRVRDAGIPAVFAEPQFNNEVLLQAAREAGVAVGVIYSGALTKEAPTYLAMMRANARSLAELLGERSG